MSADFYRTYAAVILDGRRKTRAWVEYLIARGVKAAHPDDGWHDRGRRRIQLVYPHFSLSPQIGDTIALGDHRAWRTVVVSAIEPTGPVGNGVRYCYEGKPKRGKRKGATE